MNLNDQQINYLAKLHPGQWFGFAGEQTYENLWVKDHPKPTLQEIEHGATDLQSEQKEAQANAEARRIIQERLIERELESDTDMKALIEEAKTKDNPGQWVRENVGNNA